MRLKTMVDKKNTFWIPNTGIGMHLLNVPHQYGTYFIYFGIYAH
jgi:hypothetical protein